MLPLAATHGVRPVKLVVIDKVAFGLWRTGEVRWFKVGRAIQVRWWQATWWHGNEQQSWHHCGCGKTSGHEARHPYGFDRPLQQGQQQRQGRGSSNGRCPVQRQPTSRHGARRREQ